MKFRGENKGTNKQGGQGVLFPSMASRINLYGEPTSINTGGFGIRFFIFKTWELVFCFVFCVFLSKEKNGIPILRKVFFSHVGRPIFGSLWDYFAG